jgi:hypothetical protein
MYQIYGKTVTGFTYPIDEMPLMDLRTAKECCNSFNERFKTPEYRQGEERIYWSNWWYDDPLPLKYGTESDVITKCKF